MIYRRDKIDSLRDKRIRGKEENSNVNDIFYYVFFLVGIYTFILFVFMILCLKQESSKKAAIHKKRKLNLLLSLSLVTRL